MLVNIITNAKRLYFQNSFQVNKNNGKATWQLLDELINKKSKSRNEIPSTFVNCSGETIQKAEIPESFNDFFCSIGVQLDSMITSPDNSPMDYLSAPSYQPHNNALSASMFEIKNIIKGLNPVGGGFDKISASILLGTYKSILTHLTFFFNLCLKCSVFPSKLKIAIIKPIHKSGDKDKFTNYRPISLLPIFSKILEKLIYKYLLTYLEMNNVLSPFQFGFRKRHSTYMPLVHLYDQITKTLQDNEIMCTLFLDLKKAFDTVSLDILLQKLDFVGIKGDLYKILKSYLSERLQITRINNDDSEPRLIKMGVPQGSVLGPLLFILYINDLTKLSSEASFYLFADDTAITVRAKNYVELQTNVDNILPTISKWFCANRLSLNTSKTNYQLYSRNNIKDLNILLNGTKIWRQKTIKYLGVLVDENLKWESHICKVASVISRNLGIMGRAKFFLSSRELLLLYNTLILPHLNYCAVVWGSILLD